MGVAEAWSRRGLTGLGVLVVHVDDGLDFRHPDLRPNYAPDASFDLVDADPVPLPGSNRSYHGTSMAGIVAAAGNNSVCSVGIAHEASVGE